MIVDSLKRVTLLGGGDAHLADLRVILGFAPVLVAADGGAALAMEAGLLPEAVIGDLDSLDPKLRAKLPEERVHHIAEQDSTDFDKCLRSIRAPLVLGLGFMGGRLDHQLAALNGLLTHHQRRCILIGSVDICFHAPHKLRLELAPGTRVSLLPLASVSASSVGLEWPLDGPEFSPGGRLGASNRATGVVEIQTSQPGLLVILPRAALPQAIAGLEGRAFTQEIAPLALP